MENIGKRLMEVEYNKADKGMLIEKMREMKETLETKTDLVEV